MLVETDVTAQTFIEREAEPEPAVQSVQPTHFWYYCTEPAGYYPYVRRCTVPWMTVVPQIPSDLPAVPRSMQ